MLEYLFFYFDQKCTKYNCFSKQSLQLSTFQLHKMLIVNCDILSGVDNEYILHIYVTFLQIQKKQ